MRKLSILFLFISLYTRTEGAATLEEGLRREVSAILVNARGAFINGSELVYALSQVGIGLRGKEEDLVSKVRKNSDGILKILSTSNKITKDLRQKFLGDFQTREFLRRCIIAGDKFISAEEKHQKTKEIFREELWRQCKTLLDGYVKTLEETLRELEQLLQR